MLLGIVSLLIIVELQATSRECREGNNSCLACLGSSLMLRCPVGHVISASVLAGYSYDYDECLAHDDDCLGTTASTEMERADCLWREDIRDCSFSVNGHSLVFSTTRGCGQGIARYLLVNDFHCIKSDRVLRVTNNASHVYIEESNLREEGYVISPCHPGSYSRCPELSTSAGDVAIETTKNSLFRLTALYLDLPPADDKACDNTVDNVRVTYGRGEEILICGNEIGREYFVRSSYVNITFHVTHRYLDFKGFAIKYIIDEEELPTTEDAPGMDAGLSSAPVVRATDSRRRKLKVLAIVISSVLLLVLATVAIGTCRVYKRAQGRNNTGNEESGELRGRLPADTRNDELEELRGYDA